MEHTPAIDLEVALDLIRRSPGDSGRIEMIVRRPSPGEREILDQAELNLEEGVAGDSWNVRSSKRTPDGSPHPDMQLNLINARVAAALTADPAWRAMTGDQFHIDLDLSPANLPPGTRLAFGTAVAIVTDQPHTGCVKFAQRFGLDAHRWINSPAGKDLNLRGINARVAVPGTVSAGDLIVKLD